MPAQLTFPQKEKKKITFSSNQFIPLENAYQSLFPNFNYSTRIVCNHTINLTRKKQLLVIMRRAWWNKEHARDLRQKDTIFIAPDWKGGRMRCSRRKRSLNWATPICNKIWFRGFKGGFGGKMQSGSWRFEGNMGWSACYSSF